jgi:hypothetical protein
MSDDRSVRGIDVIAPGPQSSSGNESVDDAVRRSE